MFAVVYSKATGRIRSIYVPDNDAQLSSIILSKGESIQVFQDKEYGDVNDLQERITKITGITPQDDKYAIVDTNGVVVAVVLADPDSGDIVPGHDLIKDPDVKEGYIYDKATKVFTDPNVEAVPADPISVDPIDLKDTPEGEK